MESKDYKCLVFVYHGSAEFWTFLGHFFFSGLKGGDLLRALWIKGREFDALKVSYAHQG